MSVKKKYFKLINLRLYEFEYHKILLTLSSIKTIIARRGPLCTKYTEEYLKKNDPDIRIR